MPEAFVTFALVPGKDQKAKATVGLFHGPSPPKLLYYPARRRG